MSSEIPRIKIPASPRIYCYPESETCNAKFMGVNKKNEVFLVNRQNGFVHMYDITGIPLRVRKNPHADTEYPVEPTYAAASPSGTYFVIVEQTNKKRLLLFSDAERKEAAITATAFNPMAMAVDYYDNIMMFEHGTFQERVIIFSLKENFKEYPLINLKQTLASPSAMAISIDRKIFIADDQRHCVLAFDMQGKFIGKVGNENSIKDPKKIMVTADCFLVVICKDLFDSTRVTIFNHQGLQTLAYAVDEYGLDYALTEDKRLVILGWLNYFAIYSLPGFTTYEEPNQQS